MMNTSKTNLKQHICYIYILFDENHKPNYVGRTQNVKRRMYEHKQVLGFSPTYEIVDQCSEDCRSVEKQWISKYREQGFFLRNVAYGQGPHFLSEDSRKLLSKKFTGRRVTWGDKIGASQVGREKDWSTEGRKEVEKNWFKPGHTMTEEVKEKLRQKSNTYWSTRSREEKLAWSEQSTRNNLMRYARRKEKNRKEKNERLDLITGLQGILRCLNQTDAEIAEIRRKNVPPPETGF